MDQQDFASRRNKIHCCPRLCLSCMIAEFSFFLLKPVPCVAQLARQVIAAELLLTPVAEYFSAKQTDCISLQLFPAVATLFLVVLEKSCHKVFLQRDKVDFRNWCKQEQRRR